MGPGFAMPGSRGLSHPLLYNCSSRESRATVESEFRLHPSTCIPLESQVTAQMGQEEEAQAEDHLGYRGSRGHQGCPARPGLAHPCHPVLPDRSPGPVSMVFITPRSYRTIAVVSTHSS